MPEPKTYLPRCYVTARQTQFGEFMSVNFDVEELIKFANQHKDAKGKLRLTLAKKREVGQYGDTHSCFLDTYKPQGGQRSQAPRQQNQERPSQKPPIDDTEPPF